MSMNGVGRNIEGTTLKTLPILIYPYRQQYFTDDETEAWGH